MLPLNVHLDHGESSLLWLDKLDDIKFVISWYFLDTEAKHFPSFTRLKVCNGMSSSLNYQ